MKPLFQKFLLSNLLSEYGISYVSNVITVSAILILRLKYDKPCVNQ